MSIFRKNKAKDCVNKIVVTESSASEQSDGYNKLRDQLMAVNADGNTKVIQIESSLDNECKTDVTCNLAVSLGYAGKKVAVVETDFRFPDVHTTFGTDGSDGITEFVDGKINAEQTVKSTAYPNVDVVVRGGEVANPLTVFTSEKFKELVSYLREKYDYVLLDCAPVLLVSDYIHISKVADGAVLLVAYASTSKFAVADAVSEMKRNGVKILGTAFTMYDKKKSFGYAYHYKYYGYGNSAVNDGKQCDGGCAAEQTATGDGRNGEN